MRRDEWKKIVPTWGLLYETAHHINELLKRKGKTERVRINKEKWELEWYEPVEDANNG